MRCTSNSPADTEAFGERLAGRLRAGDVVAFTGALGMGKTALTRGLARGLGCRARVTSPTFTIVNEYDGDVPLFHFDLYRLRSADELYDLGWDDYLARGGICAVEWSERAASALPEGAIVVNIARGKTDDSRVITVTGVDE
ncbi:MAG: tRNA (adenosine(37)-N6)-threonylcarbamoyltransferase complex ATPase subunit type 1 TsaE [Oscillospiraceae bacterium]|nr:tRNA (adenosine(37)-N6)-threonylcarbamoyltransferase complex ATPase subunit type 1 TsaE [Oscillospiraceae bacterium]